MATSNGWGDGAANNTIGWGQGKLNNTIGWGSVYASSNAGRTDIIGTTATAPVNTVAPVIDGNADVGSTLTLTSVGTYTGTAPITYAYQWYRGGVTAIIGQTSTTYITQVADAGEQVTCQVQASNAYGATFVSSNYIIVAPAPVNTVLPVVSGSTYVGDLLTTTNGTWSGSPTSFTYQWKRGATNIGTNANTYTLVTADANTNITCVVTATNASGSTPATSNIIATTALSAPTNITPPEIDGLAFWVSGDTISFTGNTWNGNPVPVLTYQWLRNGGNITGETNDTYLLVVADVGQSISVQCTATNSQGSAFEVSNQVTIF